MKVLYTTQATSTGGRTGHSKTADGVLDLDLITPKELGGPGNPPGGKGTNPEQLFACGYSACFLGAMKFVAALHDVSKRNPASWRRVSAMGARTGMQGAQLEQAGEDAITAGLVVRRADAAHHHLRELRGVEPCARQTLARDRRS